MVVASAEPLLQLPDVFQPSVEMHIARLFSENDIKRVQAERWLGQNADPETLARIGREVLRRDHIPAKVAREIHDFLMASAKKNIKGMGRLSNERLLDVKLALCRTLIKARRH